MKERIKHNNKQNNKQKRETYDDDDVLEQLTQ